jgi:peptidoglycan/xylan/chitin deacetylase (PgdA/CDA1 family)
VPIWLKRLVGVGLAGLLNFALRLTSRRVGVALVYHAVEDREGDPQRELVPPRERSRFRRDLRYLRRHYQVVSAAAFSAAVAARRRGRRFPVCVTFDDDLAQHVEHALPVLQEEQVPAMFFLCGASLESPNCFWWERLQRAVDNGVSIGRVVDLLPEPLAQGLPPAPDIRLVAAQIQGLTPNERDEIHAQLLALAGPDPPGAGLRSEAVVALAQGGCAIGFHTRRHDDLRGLDDQGLSRALSAGRSDLESLAGLPVEMIAYPHGSADRRVAQAAKEAGFVSGFTTTACAVTPASDPLLIGRLAPDNKPSAGEFALAMARTLVGRPCGDSGR